MKKLIVTVLVLFILVFGIYGNTVQVNDIGDLELVADDGRILLSVNTVWINSWYQNDKYLYFYDKHGKVSNKDGKLYDTKGKEIFVNKQTGNIDYQMDSPILLLTPDNKYALVGKWYDRSGAVIKFSEKDGYYEWNAAEILRPHIKDKEHIIGIVMPELYEFGTGNKIEIKNIDVSFYQKTEPSHPLAAVKYDEKTNSIIMSYSGEGGSIYYRTHVDLSTMKFNVDERFLDVYTGDVMYCTDKLKLRENPAISAEAKLIMQKGTMLKVIDSAQFEIIDNIQSRWVKVEVIKDSVTAEGSFLAKGTNGWCFGGYLNNVEDVSLIPELNGKDPASEKESIDDIQKKSFFRTLADYFLGLFKKN